MNKKISKRFLSMFFLLGIKSFSMNIMSIDVECPIGGEKFKAEVAVSGYIQGQRTDMKKIGVVASPPIIPMCPTNKFVLFNPVFYHPNYAPKDVEELPTEHEMSVYAKIIEGKEYKSIPSDSSVYYYLGRFYELLEKERDKNIRKKSNQEIAYTYLQASWLEEKEGPLRTEILKKSLYYYKKFLNEKSGQEKDRLTALVIVGELERLLGNFEKSEEHFKKLKKNKEIRKNKILKEIVDFEIELIKKKNKYPQDLEYDKNGNLKNISKKSNTLVPLATIGVFSTILFATKYYKNT